MVHIKISNEEYIIQNTTKDEIKPLLMDFLLLILWILLYRALKNIFSFSTTFIEVSQTLIVCFVIIYTSFLLIREMKKVLIYYNYRFILNEEVLYRFRSFFMIVRKDKIPFSNIRTIGYKNKIHSHLILPSKTFFSIIYIVLKNNKVIPLFDISINDSRYSELIEKFMNLKLLFPNILNYAEITSNEDSNKQVLFGKIKLNYNITTGLLMKIDTSNSIQNIPLWIHISMILIIYINIFVLFQNNLSYINIYVLISLYILITFGYLVFIYILRYPMITDIKFNSIDCHIGIMKIWKKGYPVEQEFFFANPKFKLKFRNNMWIFQFEESGKSICWAAVVDSHSNSDTVHNLVRFFVDIGIYIELEERTINKLN